MRNRIKKYCRSTAAHTLPVIALISGFLLLIHKVLGSGWATLFFNNADSLVLPLVTQSMQMNQSFNWVFSSQLFLFPEAIIYSAIALMFNDYKIALVINGLASILIFYTLLYQIIKHVSLHSLISKTLATFGSLFILCLTFFESEPINNRFIAMPFFMTTYYYGVILSSMLALLLSFKALPLMRKGFGSKKLLALLCALTVLSALATSSNPMYLLQFIAPFTIVIVLALLLRSATLRQSLVLLAPQIAGLVVGMLARKTIFKPFIAAEVTGYLHIDRIPASIERLNSLLKDSLANSLQRFEVFIIAIICILTMILFIYILYLVFKKPTVTNRKEFLPLFILSGLAALTPPLIIVGVIVTGNSEFRYLLPVIIFPLFSLGVVGYKLRSKCALKKSTLIALSLTVMAASTCVLFIAKPTELYMNTKNFYPDETRCLDSSLKDTPYKAGTAQFWRARNLQLQSKEDITVQQISPNIARYDWMSNRSAYSENNLSFVLVDSGLGETQYLQPIYKQTVLNTLGEPSKVLSCNVFDIYIYPLGTDGNVKLNQILGTGQ